MRHGRIWSAIRDHWWTGFNGALLFADSIAISLCVADWIRFRQTECSLFDAWRFGWQAIGDGHLLEWPSIVFGFFVIVLPVLTTFLSPASKRVGAKHEETGKSTRNSVPGNHRSTAATQTSSVPWGGVQSMSRPIERQWGRRSVLFGAHLVLSVGFFIFTLLAFSMETLSGWTKEEAVTYSFTSFWVFTVLWIRPFYSGLLLPVLKKFIVRRAGHEPTHFAEVLKEVATEDHLRGEG